ncbi:MAG: hypothetical protein Q8Q88_08980 [Phenylobacterium sp.]|uniref:hypothetical protein n=1 Tax=Phenylobacterium sp. TaxID=1871053 RepID=UPI0027371BAA|nr:hypothetical protein [Phenylobacterium sp.]MDP3747166.1 hypothetical protein [Phenylobacterium sp.]
MDAVIPASLRYGRQQLMASHAYAKPHDEAGYRLHGGFDAQGAYVSPRVLHRQPAVRAWGAALETRGWPLIDATTSLLQRPNYPTVAQERVLLQNGLGQSFWNSLTVTGIVEARGKALVSYVPPDMRKLIVEDIDDTATGHLHLGLLEAHGMDEGGGDPHTPDLGAHDAMWFASRDLVFGRGAYPMPAPPESISRPVATDREMPLIGPEYEGLIKMLMNVLMIEVRAESFFAFCCDVLRDPTLFIDRRAAADQAAVLVERIRQDEQIHVGYLQAVISELRSFTFRTPDGREVPGREIIDPVWADMVDWHGLREREASRGRTRAEIERQAIDMLGPQAGARLIAEFDSLEAEAT